MPSMSDTTLVGSGDALLTADQLLSECRTLQETVQSFQAQAVAQQTPVDVGPFLKSIASELRSLERLAASEAKTKSQTFSSEFSQEDLDVEISQLQHALRSSNLSFLQTVWTMAKRCEGVVALGRRENGRSNSGNKGFAVDIIASMGLLWIKIYTMAERKMLYDMAEQGWDDRWNDSEDDEEGVDGVSPGIANVPVLSETEEHKNEDGKEDPTLPLVRRVKGLIRTARDNKINYRAPEVLIWFPNMQEDNLRTPAVTKVIAYLRSAGALVHCGTGETKLQALPSLLPAEADDYRSMLPPRHPQLSSVINLDCTILLALISDLSHLRLDEKDAYNEPLKRQLVIEQARPLLPEILYPAMANRKLITSTLAARRMQDIVDTLGTPGEKARAEILLMGGGLSAATDLSDIELRGYLAEESIHDVPQSLVLPVQIIDTTADIKQLGLPPQAELLKDLSDINESVFFLGWCRNIDTITSNKTVAKKIESVINDDPRDVTGPSMYLIEFARSLVGKERDSRRAG